MKTYISILRGINVSGQKMIKMNDLRVLYEELKFKNVRTYIQSGNVIFESASKDAKELCRQIEQKISEKYNFAVPVIIRTVAEIDSILSSNPFLNSNEAERLYVTLLAEEPEEVNRDKTNELNYEPDKFFIAAKDVYLLCANGYGNTKLSNNLFEKKLKVTATTRNWRTMNELSKLAKGN
jgi:uncharacterized protein (DUF1697 family)